MLRPSFSRPQAATAFILMIFVLAFAAVSLLFVTQAEDKAAQPKAEPVLSQEAKALGDALGQLEAELNNLVSRAEVNSPADNDSASAIDHALTELRRRLVNVKNRVESLGLDPDAPLGLRNRVSILEERINRRESQKRRALRPAATVNKGDPKGARLAPAATGAISGTVTDSSTLSPITNVNIEVYNSTGAFVASTMTDGSGNYTSPAVLATGNYFVRTTNALGYINEVYNNITCVICNPITGTAVAVTDGATTSGINFALAPGGRISGTVTNASTAAPLVGVNVQIFDSGGAFVANGNTDGSGNYISDAGLPAGNYFARTNNSQGFIDKLYNNITCAPCNPTSGTPITVTGTSTTSGINFALNAGGRISGNVTDASSAAAIANVNVDIFNSTGAFVTSGFTDGAGNYTTGNGLVSGSYFARTNNSSGYVNKLYNNITCVSCNVTSGTPISVTAGATTSGISFALNLGGRISGTVTD
ncbi:MAG TPA: carboxypeptidase-like regulatory domain-containing protein, partial [Blastocatellia bacterium]|nr:carboxypeptidase-like regulatory domain-containing protein [Blastocatellia bacterium]